MNIKVLGPGCFLCKKLEQNVKRAIKETGSNASFEKIEDLQQIMVYGILTTPALVIDEKVMFSGKVPSVDVIKKLL